MNPEAPRVIGTSLGPYEIVAKLGAGGMGEVYRARDTKLDRDVAIKVLPADFDSDPERLARFEREAKLLASLNHTNIATIHGLDDAEDKRFIVMELVEGQSLAERLAAGRVELDEAIGIARQIVAALEAAHGSGVVHRDLKPANVMVTPAGGVKVLDFGLAKAFDADGSPSSTTPEISNSPTMMGATRSGMIIGTAAYMSPEQAAGAAVDNRTDIWAFGVVLYELLGGGRLFHGESAAHVLADVLKTEPDLERLPPETPAAMRRLLRRCLHKKADRRLHHIADARLEIDEALDPTLAEPRTPGSTDSATPLWRRSLPWAIAATAVVAAAAWAIAGSGAPPLARDPVRTFEITVPGLPFWVWLSPDGSELAYWRFGESRTDPNEVIIHDLESNAGRVVYETETRVDSYSPIMRWAPDGSAILVGYGPRAVVIPTDGRPSRTVPNLADSIGLPRFHDTESLVFASEAGIERITIDGGERSVLLRAEDAGEIPGLPIVLPDATFLYRLRTGDGAALVHHDGKQSRTLVEFPPLRGAGGSDFRLVGGTLLFLSDDGLMALPFDPAAPARPGTPVRIVPGAESFTVSTSGSLIYYTSSRGDAFLDIVPVDRTGEVGDPLVRFEGQLPHDLHLSPDGRFLAVLADDPTGLGGNPAQAEVWIYDLVDRTAPSLLPGARPIAIAGWLPGGESIAIARDTEEGPKLGVEDPAGAGTHFELMGGQIFSLSPDARSVVYSERGPDSEPMIVAVEPDGTLGVAERFVRDLRGADLFAISPNGRWMAFSENDPDVGWEVWTAAFPGGGALRRVAEGSRPRWSREGTELFFVAGIGDARRLMAVQVDAERGIASGSPVELFRLRGVPPAGALVPRWAGYMGPGYDVTPDGQTFWMVRRFGGPTDRQMFFVQNWRQALLGDVDGSR